MISRYGRPELDATPNVAARFAPNRAYNKRMYHYNPSTALEELNEEATLPNPVHVRDMMLRRKLSADQALELNRIFLEYQKFFGETQKLGKDILKRLAASFERRSVPRACTGHPRDKSFICRVHKDGRIETLADRMLARHQIVP